MKRRALLVRVKYGEDDVADLSWEYSIVSIKNEFETTRTRIRGWDIPPKGSSRRCFSTTGAHDKTIEETIHIVNNRHDGLWYVSDDNKILSMMLSFYQEGKK